MKRIGILATATGLAILAALPAIASAHTRVFVGVNLGGLFDPAPIVYAPSPPVVYTTPAYYPPPRTYYEPAPAYYAPRIYYAPRDYRYDRRGWRDHDEWHDHDRGGRGHGRHWRDDDGQ